MILTFVSLAITAGAITERVLSESDRPTGDRDEFVWDEYLSGGVRELAGSSFVTGISQTVPELEMIPRLNSIPWGKKEVTDLFERAGSYSACEVLPSDVAVTEPLSRVASGSSGPLGRFSMFSIGLQMDPEAEESLPAASDGAIKAYLKDHLLTVQSPFYRYPDGTVFFGTKMKAAFFATASPERTLTPEPVISSAVGRFRTLGVYAPAKDVSQNEGQTEASGDTTTPDTKPDDELRTLILGFKYTVAASQVSTADTNERQAEYELLFLHLLPDNTAERPSVAVFGTSNGRTILHELDLSRDSSGRNSESVAQLPEITADIRFDEFALMGLYPAKPVVTGVSHRARQSLPSEIVRGLMLGLTRDQPESLTSILDKLHAKVGGNVTASDEL
ncbi:MAG: hypothetical protein KDA93_00825 [Planctomycetaceae bacterium]|nr:hypothetical protein [Planctomycetaceae bacterium]